MGQKIYEGLSVMKIGFIGLGRMGGHVAANLLKAQQVHIELQRRIEIAHAQHGVQKSHGDLLVGPDIGPFSRRRTR